MNRTVQNKSSEETISPYMMDRLNLGFYSSVDYLSVDIRRAHQIWLTKAQLYLLDMREQTSVVPAHQKAHSSFHLPYLISRRLGVNLLIHMVYFIMSMNF